MIGRRDLPAEYLAWNDKYGAPFGYAGNRRYQAGQNPYTQLRAALADPRGHDHGPFGFQLASYTRVYEYPWAYLSAGVQPGMSVIDIGGGTAGLQYVAAMDGARVTNIEAAARPGTNQWADEDFTARHALLNETFGTDVRLVASRVQDADLPAASFDRIFCLSVLEHVDAAEANEMMASAARLLRPGGLLLATVDLFLDLRPFGVLSHNRWGVNHDVAALIAHSGLGLDYGDRRELLGTAEFDRDRIVALLPELLISEMYPVMTQALILRKPAA
jgi:SAM-dependent methyltransferase